jgi:hypothetical protein
MSSLYRLVELHEPALPRESEIERFRRLRCEIAVILREAHVQKSLHREMILRTAILIRRCNSPVLGADVGDA